MTNPLQEELLSMLSSTGMFHDMESKVLRGLLSLRSKGKMKVSAAEIASAASISVTNTYKYLYSLEMKGVVETNKEKNKLFWISSSSNPFPRLFSFVGQDYLKKKEAFKKLENIYDRLVPIDRNIWLGEKIHSEYNGNFRERAAFLLDIAKEEVLITTSRALKDFIILDAIGRALKRGISVKIISSESEPETTEKLKSLGADIRFGNFSQSLIVVDNRHGITLDNSEGGLWFLNYSTDYKRKFTSYWNSSQAL